jgi:hypothetical protein
MKFPYEKITTVDNSVIYRPIIPVVFVSDTSDFTFGCNALLDSGADVCLFDLEFCGLLGIDPNSCEKSIIAGVGGGLIDAYFHEVRLHIGETEIKTRVGFTDGVTAGYGLLGQRGFFEHFDIEFNYKKKFVELR